MGLPAQAGAHFVRLVEEKAGMPAGKLDVAQYQLDIPGLIVHAADDPVVPFNEAEAIHQAWFDSRLLRLEAGGHQRVLADPRLHEAVVQLLGAVRHTSSSALAS
jgi:pimeloyl-ACP methyl ester carboxylesterase